MSAPSVKPPLFDCGPSWTLVSYTSPVQLATIFSLTHVNGRTETLVIGDFAFLTNPVREHQRVRAWVAEQMHASVDGGARGQA